MPKTNLRAIKEWASSYSLQKVTPFCFIFQCTLMTSCFLSLIAYTMRSNSWVIKFCLEWPPTSLDFWIFIVQYSSCSLNTHHHNVNVLFCCSTPMVVTQLQSFVLLWHTAYLKVQTFKLHPRWSYVLSQLTSMFKLATSNFRVCTPKSKPIIGKD